MRCKYLKILEIPGNISLGKPQEVCGEYLVCPVCQKTFKYEWQRPQRTIWVPQQFTCINCKSRVSTRDWDVELSDVPQPGQPGPDVGGVSLAARDSFVQRIISRVGGKYCSPPGRGCTDCSGLVAEEYKNATGRTITGSSYHQYQGCHPVTPQEVRAGDLVFHHTFGGEVNGNLDSHVGVVINNWERVDAMNETQGIVRGMRDKPYWYNTFTRAGRLPF